MGNTYKSISVVGSGDSIEAAVQSAVQDASRTLRHLRWFEVREIRGRIEDQADLEYQVKVDIGFRIDGE